MSDGGDQLTQPSILSKNTTLWMYMTPKAPVSVTCGATILMVYALAAAKVPMKLVDFFYDSSIAEPRDLLYGVLVCLVLVIIRQLFLIYLRPFARYFVVQKKYTKDKVDRWCTVVFKSMWFALIC